jgi:Uma2 family endonuclease
MAQSVPRAFLEVRYYEEAQAYLRSLSPELFMEKTTQANQRKIFVVGMDLVHEADKRIQPFHELLVQYRRGKSKKPGQVVPDSMVVVHLEPIKAGSSFDVPLQPVCPFWVVDYVCKNSNRKDYEESWYKYENDLKVPYYLLCYPDAHDMTLYYHNGKRYLPVKPNENGRLPIPELEMELGLLDGWVRFWFRGELLPLPADLQRELIQTRVQLKQTQELLEQTQLNLQQAIQRASALEQELAQLRERLGQTRPPENP